MLLRNNGKPEIATAVLIVGALCNIVLDYFMIVELRWQLLGAALATLISQGIVALGALYFLLNSCGENKPRGALNLSLIFEIFKQGAAGLVMFLYFGFIIALHNKQLLIFASEVEVAAFAVVGYLGVIYYFIAEGVASGVQPPISYYFGAGLYQRIRIMFKLALKVSLGFGVVMVTVFYLFPTYVLGLFSEDLALLNAAERGLQLHLSTLFLDGFIFLTSMYFVAVGKGGKALAISLGNMLVQLPFLYVLPLWFGVDGVWLAVPISNITLTVIIIPLLWRDLYQLKRADMEATSGDKQCA
ncbi:MATE family efflux transporter [Pseudoalteromonas sp. S2755]|uniref:MATE family efflux transporter n=1 Tax=Pseudoalteromonas sp. S2755 TaxID=2066523 RepID=UPI002016A1F2|nr:MATE family efflux transporter [Pseudoalteromonas sp. S2755]